MQQRSLSIALLLLVLATVLCSTAPAAAATKAAKGAKATAVEPVPAKEKIEYENLHGYLGDRITVHTTYGTTRTGVLAKFSNSELTLTMDSGVGASELTIPRNTIADMVSAPAPASAKH
jgi:hypothetical protein